MFNPYQPQGIEKWTDKFVGSANTLYNIGYYTSPFILMYAWRRGFISSFETLFLVQCLGGMSCLLVIAVILRGIARAMNPKYVEFVNALAVSPNDTRALLNSIRKYDFDFKYWPCTFRVPQRVRYPWFTSPYNRCASPDLPPFKRAMIQTLAYIATHTFGLRLIYPGSVALINHVLWVPALQGRTQLVEGFEGQRTKVGTAENNYIDTMFIDNRAHSAKGRTLVVCCEGNSGFYEVGIMTAPAKTGYSVLGWNHPGFGGSTGQPYPSQEQNAIDAVIQYAINELNFMPENMVMYGWSIGGYTATWAAVNYPMMRGLILDATFDDLLPLAENQMPPSWSLLVKEVVRSHVNLNVAEMVEKFNGPVQLIRRTEDEIISLRQGVLSTNRGNPLLVRLVESRHRMLHSNTRECLRQLVGLNDAQRTSLNFTSINEYEQRALRLIGTYLRDIKTNHCSPLTEMQFDSIMTIILNMAHPAA
ncbi:protein ABHD16A isoform X3 [Ostrinia furnacalis]|uniref:protein ABHD16A isoform X3 n=1 Tax=Ostrinia furnacalis TaxID=93504 RepID=UPI00103CCF40|nr:protein ABHD16A isoform X3 [Ostrinia furnacalis]